MLTVLNGPTIAANESLSDGVDLQGGDLVRITCPADWTEGANITFEISTDGNGYNALFTPEGEEVTVVCTPGAAIILREQYWARAINFLKVRSGTRDNPFEQEAQREFAIAVETPAGAGGLGGSGR
jgi:hypothetical protein